MANLLLLFLTRVLTKIVKTQLAVITYIITIEMNHHI